MDNVIGKRGTKYGKSKVQVSRGKVYAGVINLEVMTVEKVPRAMRQDGVTQWLSIGRKVRRSKY